MTDYYNSNREDAEKKNIMSFDSNSSPFYFFPVL